MKTLDEIRAEAQEHAKQLEAVAWVDVKTLATRWHVSEATVRKIDRAKLPFITLGSASIRRYSAEDVERFEAEERKAPEEKSA